MRSKHEFLLGVILLGFLFSSPSDAHIASSFGPEISAEDFNQHVHSISELKSGPQRQAYLVQQFSRLGLNLGALNCPATADGWQASLAGADSRSGDTVYFADINDAYQLASVLEIAERFMTNTPRPMHNVHFVFSGSAPEALSQCPPFNPSRHAIQAKAMEKLDRSSLVRDLNALQRQGN